MSLQLYWQIKFVWRWLMEQKIYYSLMSDPMLDTKKKKTVQNSDIWLHNWRKSHHWRKFCGFYFNSWQNWTWTVNWSLNKIKQDRIDTKNAWGQLYDNCANMARIYKGVQAKLMRQLNSSHFQQICLI
jgi:hypothetical protein